MTAMYAVVSLLDEAHYRRVEAIWADLREACGIHGVYATPFPHFSYHVAPAYDMDRLEGVLRRVAASTPPFRVTTSGLGIFPGPSPVVFVPVVRSPQLTALHKRLWPQVDRRAQNGQAYYRPENWVPHITLGHGDLCEVNLARVVDRLARLDLYWDMAIDNLAVISSTGDDQGLHLRLPLGL